LVVAILMTALGFTERLLGNCGLDGLTEKNDAYLESSFERSLRTFAVLSTIKVGLAVVEGTEIGVGFGLEVGDVVQAAYDYVDIAWRTVLAGGVILLATRTLLEAASLVNHWLLAATLTALALMVITQGAPPGFPRIHRVLGQVGLFMTVLTTACYLILPVSIAGGAYLSSKITAPSIEEAESGLTALTEELFPEPEDQTAEGGLRSKWAQTKERINRMASYLKEKTSELIVSILKLIAGYLFDCLVFPLGLFVLLVWFTRGLARSLFGVG
jgi:predicted PurR-regulated permease PerM